MPVSVGHFYLGIRALLLHIRSLLTLDTLAHYLSLVKQLQLNPQQPPPPLRSPPSAPSIARKLAHELAPPLRSPPASPCAREAEVREKERERDREAEVRKREEAAQSRPLRSPPAPPSARRRPATNPFAGVLSLSLALSHSLSVCLCVCVVACVWLCVSAYLELSPLLSLHATLSPLSSSLYLSLSLSLSIYTHKHMYMYIYIYI